MQLRFKWGVVNIISGGKKSPAFILAEQTVALIITSLVVISLVTFWGGVRLVRARLTEQIVSARLLKEGSDRYRDTQVAQNYQVDGYQVQVNQHRMQVSKHQRCLIQVIRQ